MEATKTCFQSLQYTKTMYHQCFPIRAAYSRTRSVWIVDSLRLAVYKATLDLCPPQELSSNSRRGWLRLNFFFSSP